MVEKHTMLLVTHSPNLHWQSFGPQKDQARQTLHMSLLFWSCTCDRGFQSKTFAVVWIAG